MLDPVGMFHSFTVLLDSSRSPEKKSNYVKLEAFGVLSEIQSAEVHYVQVF